MEIANKDVTGIEKLKKRGISTGDYFFYNNNLIRISDITRTNDNIRIVHFSWIVDYEKNEILDSYGSSSLEEFAKAHSGDFIPDIRKWLEIAKNYMDGELPDFLTQSEQNSTCTDISLCNSSTTLKSMMDCSESILQKTGILQRMVKYRMEVAANRMKKIQRELEKKTAALEKQRSIIASTISMIELYNGINENIQTLSTGKKAEENEPFAIHQQLLFMDEECGILGEDNQGIDINDLDKFSSWLIEDNRIDTFIPQKKGIVAMKPRRYRKEYADAWEQAEMDRWNKHTFFLIRNNENIYLIDSDNIELSDRLFPLRNELDSLYKTLSNEGNSWDKVNAENSLEKKQTTYRRLILFLQGLLDRTDILSPYPKGINIARPETYQGFVNLIYDDEPSLTDGRRSFEMWKKEVNTVIGRGSRIVFVQPARKYCTPAEKMDYYNNHAKRKIYNEYIIPPKPQNGLYTVEESNGEMLFKYSVAHDYETDYEGRNRQRISFLLREDDMFLNYDGLALEDVNYYINSRMERKNYLYVLPVLLELRKRLKGELTQESEFKKMLLGMAVGKGMDEKTALKKIEESVNWWKFKNIWKRPISRDDSKAMRMIMQRVMRTESKHSSPTSL